MRKTLFCVLMMTLLAGCGSGGGEATADELAVRLRTEYLAAPGCAGTACVTADYGDRVYEFTLDFTWAREGETVLTVTSPEDVAGITATVGAGESRLEYQGVGLGTGDLTGEGLTPLEFLPAVMGYMDSGYMAQCVLETLEGREVVRILFRDPEGAPQSGLECTLWVDRESSGLVRAELSQDGTLVLSSDFDGFTLGEKADGTEADEDLGGD